MVNWPAFVRIPVTLTRPVLSEGDGASWDWVWRIRKRNGVRARRRREEEEEAMVGAMESGVLVGLEDGLLWEWDKMLGEHICWNELATHTKIKFSSLSGKRKNKNSLFFYTHLFKMR